MTVNQTHLTVISVTRAIGVVTQRQQVGELGHGLEGMVVFDGIEIFATTGANGRWWCCGLEVGFAGQ